MGKIIINDEECRVIPGFKRYHISEYGRVYRTETGKKRTWRTKGRVYISESKVHFRVRNGKLKQGRVSLTDAKGKLHNISVAPLVAIAFGLIDKKTNIKKKDVDFKDGNVRNLHYTNLFVREKVHPMSKLTKEDVKHIKKYIRQGVSLRHISRIFCVSEMQINRIKTGENWGNGRRKIKAPKAPFNVKDGRMRKYIATFEREKVAANIRKRFAIKRNPEKPTDNLIVGIVNGYKLSLKHANITRAREIVDKLNAYFFDSKIKNETTNIFEKQI